MEQRLGRNVALAAANAGDDDDAGRGGDDAMDWTRRDARGRGRTREGRDGDATRARRARSRAEARLFGVALDGVRVEGDAADRAGGSGRRGRAVVETVGVRRDAAVLDDVSVRFYDRSALRGVGGAVVLAGVSRGAGV